MVLHGAGEHVERVLEADGIFLDAGAGVPAMRESGVRERALLAMHDLNQRLTAMFTEAMAPAVSVRAADRGIFVEKDSGATRGGLAWLEKLTRMPAIPVIATTWRSDTGHEVGEPSRSLQVLLEASSLKLHPVLFTRTNLPGVMIGRDVVPSMTFDDERLAAALGTGEPLEMLRLGRVPFLLTNAARLASGEIVEGTRVSAEP